MKHRGKTGVAAFAAFTLGIAGCSGGGGSGGAVDVGAALVEAFGGLSVNRPVKLVQHPTNDDRWYVVQQTGEIQTFLASNPGGTKTLAVDVGDDVANFGSGGEQGLLSMVFAPDFATSGEIYLTYTDEGLNESVLDRYESNDGGLTFAPSVGNPVLSIPHPSPNHNGGDLAFGPNDGFLYYSMGDGGIPANGQNPDTLLGSILRLDVNGAPPMGRDYVIPAGNPFSANAYCDTGSGAMACPEIWIYGLRNPWRMHFDLMTGDLWLGDVGEDTQEEIDVVPDGMGGGNYGWACLEGDFVLDPGCNTAGFEPPEAVHDHPEAEVITGGLVYRGSALPQLVGHYVYGDFVRGKFWSIDLSSPTAPPVALALPTVGMSAFGRDRAGEIYVLTFSAPAILKLVPAVP